MPPLNALKAFEAAARHLSFTKASEELNVTQAAVSHQVKMLEEYFGITLFNRAHQRLTLTDAGRSYLPKLTQAFDLIAEGYLGLHQEKLFTRLNIKAPSSFSSQWLVPRLHRFQASHPDIDIRLSAQDNDIDFFPDAFDVEIRYLLGNGHQPNSTLLLKEEIFPVCSPRLLEGDHPLKTPEDLRHHTLLHINFYPEDWKMWLDKAEVSDIDYERGHRFDQSVLTLKAATQGLGVAMGRTPIASPELKNGSLVAPFDIKLNSSGGYWLIFKSDVETRQPVVELKEWMLQEARRDQNGSIDKG
jgi:LysR family glycine cleavage system transcriptional activator